MLKSSNNKEYCMYRSLCITLFSLLIGIQSVQAGKPILPAPQKIAAHSYAWIGPLPGPNKQNQGFRMNLGFVVGSKAIAVIDTGYTPAMAREMLAHIRQVSTLPIVYGINTNSQPHRFFGNKVFQQAGAKIIAHPLEKDRMQQSAGQFVSGIERALQVKAGSVAFPSMPTLFVADHKDIDLGGVTLHIRHHGASHTPAPLVVHVVQDNVVYAGDSLYSGRLLSVLDKSNVKSWLQTFDALKQYQGATFVPGHGEPAGLAAFEFPTRSYLQLLYTHMKKSVDDGLDSQDAINSLDQTAYSQLALYDVLAGRNASWAYLQAEAAAFE